MDTVALYPWWSMFVNYVTLIFSGGILEVALILYRSYAIHMWDTQNAITSLLTLQKAIP